MDDCWGYSTWGLVIIGVVVFLFIFTWGMNKMTNKKNKPFIDFDLNEDDEFNLEKQEALPGLGKSPVGSEQSTIGSPPVTSRQAPVGSQQPGVDEGLVVLRIRLECADMIIPDVSFGESDPFEVIQWKQEVMKVKKILKGLLDA